MFFERNKDTTKYGVLFEVGSGSVAGAIVSSDPHTLSPTILYTAREFISLKQTSQSEDISKRLLSVFLNIAMEVEAKVPQYTPKKSKLTSIHINFTSPWAHTQSSTHTFKSDQPTLITEKLLNKINAIIDKKQNEEVSTFDTLKNKNYTLINRVVSGYTANNYPIDNPINQTVRTLTTTVTTSIVSDIVLLPVEDILRKLFHNVAMQFSTSSLIQQYYFQAQADIPSSYVIIHLTHEALELTIYRDNKIVATFDTPIGINTIARNIAKASKLSHEQTYSYLTATSTTLYHEPIQEKIQNAIEASVLTPLAEFFSTVQVSEFLPHDIFVITASSPSPIVTDIIAHALKRANNNRFLLHNFPMPTNHKIVNTTTDTNDVGIYTLAYFFHNKLPID